MMPRMVRASPTLTSIRRRRWRRQHSTQRTCACFSTMRLRTSSPIMRHRRLFRRRYSLCNHSEAQETAAAFSAISPRLPPHNSISLFINNAHIGLCPPAPIKPKNGYSTFDSTHLNCHILSILVETTMSARIVDTHRRRRRRRWCRRKSIRCRRARTYAP